MLTRVGHTSKKLLQDPQKRLARRVRNDPKRHKTPPQHAPTTLHLLLRTTPTGLGYTIVYSRYNQFPSNHKMINNCKNTTCSCAICTSLEDDGQDLLSSTLHKLNLEIQMTMHAARHYSARPSLSYGRVEMNKTNHRTCKSRHCAFSLFTKVLPGRWLINTAKLTNCCRRGREHITSIVN